MAINYGTLGLTLTPPPTYGTTQTSTGGPTPSGMPQFPIGTGKASGTGSVGSTTTTQYGDDNTYTGTLDVTQIDKLTSAPVDKTAKSYPEGIKGWLEEKIDSALAPNVEYNSVTGTYRATDAGMAGIVAPMFAGAFQFAADLNKANLEGIADAAYRGKEGYGVAYFNNQVVGVSPGPFGFKSVLSGTLPSGMTAAQEAQLKSNVLGLENRSGAYMPGLNADTVGQWNNATYSSSGLTREQYFDPANTIGPMDIRNRGLSTGYSPYASSSSLSSDAGFAPTPTYGGSMAYGSDGTGYSVGAGRSAVTDGSGNVVTSFDYNTGQRAAVTSTDYSYSGGQSGYDSSDRDNSGSGGDGEGFGTGEGEIGGLSHAKGGRIGKAAGGRADGPGSESEGHSSHGFDGGRSDAGGNEDHSNSGGSESYDRSAISQQIQNMIQESVQNTSMSPQDRYASNAEMLDKTPDISTLDSYKKEGIDIGSTSKAEQKGFGESIAEAITTLGQYGILGSLGLVPFREGGDVTEGFVNKDPESVSDAQSIADNRHTSVKAGSFVVNQPANEKNKKKLDKIVADASKTAKMKKGGKAGMVDVALSDGERLIEPEVVAVIEKKHGKNFLDKMNDAGKPEVKRRQAKYGEKIGAAQGSFITDQGMELSDVGEDIDMEEYLPVSDELKAKLSKFASRKPQRGQIKSFIKSLSPEDKLTVLFLTETQSTTDPIESMEAIGEVVKNRMDSDYYDFKNLKTLDDVLLKQIAKNKSFQFSGLEPTTFYDRAVEVKKGLADKGLAKAAAAAQNILNPETEGVQRLPANTLFYTRKDAPSQWMRESKKLEFSTELGGHEFYRTFAAPELP